MSVLTKIWGSDPKMSALANGGAVIEAGAPPQKGGSDQKWVL